ncbi:MAG: hypothetical protein ABS80_16950 [Pseudonocardia sp. SCN 72-51]|nr:MAG: hypothetical protein ABS80_16950 [Pseudonocardia sp. SCN 72-51]
MIMVRSSPVSNSALGQPGDVSNLAVRSGASTTTSWPVGASTIVHSGSSAFRSRNCRNGFGSQPLVQTNVRGIPAPAPAPHPRHRR